MIQIERAILEQISAMSKNVASKDAARYFLTAVCLDSPGETRRLRLRCTDAHKLVEATYSLDSLPELLERKECLVYPEAVKSIELMLKNNKRQSMFFVCVDSNKLKVTDNPKGDLVTMGEIKAVGEYPNSDRIKPNGDGYTFTVGLNAKYLLDMVKASNSDSENVRLTFKSKPNGDVWELDKLAPVLVNVVAQDNEYGLLMPVRV